MRFLLSSALIAGAALALAGCASSKSYDADDLAQSPQAAHEMFVSAINTNELDRVLWMLDPEVEMLPPHEPRLVGRPAVRPWAQGYLNAYVTHWDKTTTELVVNGDWAFEQYTYNSKDTPRAGGQPVFDSGKGMIIYHRGGDGGWRVWRDIWNSDKPVSGR